jgi:hypothetical protein
MKTIWSEFTQAWWPSLSSLRLLASNNKDQPPPPYHLENHLILVDLIKVIPLGLMQSVLESPVSPLHILAMLNLTLFYLMTVTWYMCVHLYRMYCVFILCLCCAIRIYLSNVENQFSSNDCVNLQYCDTGMCYRYCDPVIKNHLAVNKYHTRTRPAPDSDLV